MKLARTKFWSKKTVRVTKGGETTETITETNKPPKDFAKKMDKVNEKFEKIMDDFSNLMDEL